MVIKMLRTERGWSQEQLAEISGVSTRTIQRIERGGKASLESLKCLAAVFETPIPDLMKDNDMTSSNADDKGVNETENILSNEDRAALKYARYLKAYDEKYNKDIDVIDPEMPAEEKNVVREVRRLKNFYISVIGYCILVLFLLVINLLTSPGYLWVVWPAMGMGIAILFDAFKVFGIKGQLGDDWERRQIEKRLRNL